MHAGPLARWAADTASSPVVTLSEADFADRVERAGAGRWFIDFYAPVSVVDRTVFLATASRCQIGHPLLPVLVHSGVRRARRCCQRLTALPAVLMPL